MGWLGRPANAKSAAPSAPCRLWRGRPCADACADPLCAAMRTEASMQEHDVVGIGNAIVDIIGRCDDAFLARQGSAKGSMQLVDAAAAARLYDAMGPAVGVSGGSRANTIVGGSSVAARPRLIGRPADDAFACVWGQDTGAAGVTFTTAQAAKASGPTGRCLVLVTPDGQRTMHTFLGVSPQLGGGEVDPLLVASA